MITATVRYKLPPHIDEDACRAHFHTIAPGFQTIPRADATAFYSGPWLDGIVARYGMAPEIELYEVFALTDNARGSVERFEAPALR